MASVVLVESIHRGNTALWTLATSFGASKKHYDEKFVAVIETRTWLAAARIPGFKGIPGHYKREVFRRNQWIVGEISRKIRE